VTIPGVVTVVDSGIQRGASYSPWTGLRLVTDSPVTQASAIQRAGRAGRTSPGVCHRLYSEQDFRSRQIHTSAEIERADLTDAYLLSRELSGEILWPTPPPAERWQKARELCLMLGLITEKNYLTSLGKKVQDYPTDVRIGRVLAEGEKLPPNEKSRLIRFISEVIEKDNSGVLERRMSQYLRSEGSSNIAWEKCVLTGFIDQVSRFRPKTHDFIHYSGKTIKAHAGKSLHGEYFLILDISQRQEAIEVLEIDEGWLFDQEPFPFKEEVTIDVDEKFRQKTSTKLGSIVIDETSTSMNWAQLPEEHKIKVKELGERPFQKRWQEWQQSELFGKFNFWARINEKSFDQALSSVTLTDYLDKSLELSWDFLETYFENSLRDQLSVDNINSLPDKLNFGARRDMKVHYPVNQDPFVEAPIQDFYGVKETPRISGNIPVTLKLLGPHKRPIQVTKDLAGFWKKTYHEMKKELQRDYPRHYWPDRPEEAQPFFLKSHLPKS